MANAKISELTELTSPATGDLLPIVDVSDNTDAASGTTKKITLANLKASGADVDAGTEDVKFTTPKSLADAGVYQAGGTDVAIADGGTGQSTATAAFDALAPTTTQGDIIYHNGTDNVRLAKGTALQVIRMNSGATAPEWAANVSVSSGAITKDISSATTTTIAHGLGIAPKLVKLRGVVISNAAGISFADSVYSASTQSSISWAIDSGSGTAEEIGQTFKLTKAAGGVDYTTGAITVDATNISITWSLTSSPTGTANLIWEAYA